MAYFAPVAPIQVLEQLLQFVPKAFGDYHLFLAHHTVANIDRFTALAEQMVDKTPDAIIIMDNSVVECGGFVDLDMMKKACQPFIDADIQVIPVLPDVMGDGPATRKAVAEAYPYWEEAFPKQEFMVVTQGNDFGCFMQSLDFLGSYQRFPKVGMLGVPRFLVKTLGTREHATQAALHKAEAEDLVVHLLGYSDKTEDDLKCSLIEGVFGIDSAVPLRIEGDFAFGQDYPPRPKDWFDVAKINANMVRNLAFVRDSHHGLIEQNYSNQ